MTAHVHLRTGKYFPLRLNGSVKKLQPTTIRGPRLAFVWLALLVGSWVVALGAAYGLMRFGVWTVGALGRWIA